MSTTRTVRGIELRYLLTLHLFNHGPATVAELAAALESQGFGVSGRASKVISDALRWERGHSRVRCWGRGRYGPGWMPRGTEHRIHRRVMALRDEVESQRRTPSGDAALSLVDGRPLNRDNLRQLMQAKPMERM